MSTHQQLVALANAIQGVRPDWQQAGILSQLKTLAETWGGTDGALSVHAMTIAAHPQARTPAAFNAGPPPSSPATPPTTQKTWSFSPQWGEPRCYICGDKRSACHSRRAFELRHHIPDPHEFETAEQAEERATGRQIAT
jgi:hypothetical protein